MAIDPMMDLHEAASAVAGRVVGGNARFSGVTTDTRRIAPGDLYVALKGERFDGHAFVREALERGAAAALVSQSVEGAASQLVVDDTRAALGRLASQWRQRFAIPVVALTGSNGKTTVKDMLTSILTAHTGSREAVHATQGNFNNDIGMPLTLLALRERHRYAVIEMGMNHAGEIEYLTRLARPTVALVNNAQRAHVGLLGSVAAIAKAKGEIFAGLPASGVAIINADDAYAGQWREQNAAHRIVSFGLGLDADVHATHDGGQLRIVTPADAFAVSLQVAGEHNVRNALAACAAAHALEIPVWSMQSGLAGFAGVPGRLQRRRVPGGGWVIDDSYNANPESMQAALQVLSAQPGRRVFVMGDMGELGDGAPAMHREIGAFARAGGLDALFTLGASSRLAAEAFGMGARTFDDVTALIAAARAEAIAGATILVKGSRFMRMERIADALAGDRADAA